MSATSPTTYRTERLYVVGEPRRGRHATHPVWAPTREQAWEAVRVRLVEDLATAAPRAVPALREALRELERTGPRTEGWSVAVEDHAYGYRPWAMARPSALTRGETALLLALASAD